MQPPKKIKSSLDTPVAGMAPVPDTKDEYVLRLFVAGASTRSHQAIQQVRTLCETVLLGRVNLEVIDIYLHPMLARKNQIVVTPTLIRQLPIPVRRFIGNMTTITELFSNLS